MFDMAYSRATRNRMLIAVVLILFFGGALLAWESTRKGSAATGAKATAQAVLDPAAVQAVLDDERMRALGPLAPPVVPKDLGNSAPFPIPERHL